MKYRIELLRPGEINLLENLAVLTELNEPIDYDCQFLVARNGSTKIYGFAGVNLLMQRYPQFEHIVIHPSVINSRLAVLLMKKMEDFLREKGYKEYVSYILNTRNDMQSLALKWGMKPYSHTENGVWFYKQLNKENNNVRWKR